MLYSDVSDKSVEFEGEAEDVVVVAAVPHHEAAVGLPRQDPLSSLARQWTPVPTSLKPEATSDTLTEEGFSTFYHSRPSLSRCWLRSPYYLRPGRVAGLVARASGAG